MHTRPPTARLCGRRHVKPAVHRRPWDTPDVRAPATMSPAPSTPRGPPAPAVESARAEPRPPGPSRKAASGGLLTSAPDGSALAGPTGVGEAAANEVVPATGWGWSQVTEYTRTGPSRWTNHRCAFDASKASILANSLSSSRLITIDDWRFVRNDPSAAPGVQASTIDERGANSGKKSRKYVASPPMSVRSTASLRLGLCLSHAPTLVISAGCFRVTYSGEP